MALRKRTVWERRLCFLTEPYIIHYLLTYSSVFTARTALCTDNFLLFSPTLGVSYKLFRIDLPTALWSLFCNNSCFSFTCEEVDTLLLGPVPCRHPRKWTAYKAINRVSLVQKFCSSSLQSIQLLTTVPTFGNDLLHVGRTVWGEDIRGSKLRSVKPSVNP